MTEQGPPPCNAASSVGEGLGDSFDIPSTGSDHTYCTGEPLVPLHTLYNRTYIVRVTSSYQPERQSTSWFQAVIAIPPGTSLWQLEDISPPSSTDSKRFWTREEVDGGHNKGPPQTSQGAKSVPRWWCARAKPQCTDKYTHKGGNNNFIK